MNKMEEIENASDTTFQDNLEKELKCEICEKVFKNKRTLKAHHAIHANNEKKYSCDVCSRFFRTKTNINTHVKTTHARGKKSQQMWILW